MTGLYVGIGIGVVVIIIVVVVIVAVCCFCNKKPSSVSPSAPQVIQMQPQVAVPVAATVPVDATVPDAQVDKFTRLKELKQLLDGGVLSQEEFDAQKRAILQN